MKNVIVLLAEGFEEMEAVIPIDLMRRAGLNIQVVSMNNTLRVIGSRGIVLEADVLFSDIQNMLVDSNLPDALFLPGGLNGSINLSKHSLTESLLKTMFDAQKPVAVVCAAPIIVLASLGLLNGRSFTCYPGMEKELQYVKDADVSGYKSDRVVIDGNLITSQGPGTAAKCAFALIEILTDKVVSENVRKAALFTV